MINLEKANSILAPNSIGNGNQMMLSRFPLENHSAAVAIAAAAKVATVQPIPPILSNPGGSPRFQIMDSASGSPNSHSVLPSPVSDPRYIDSKWFMQVLFL